MSAKVTRRAALIAAGGYLTWRIVRSGGQVRPGPPAILQPSGDLVRALAVSRSGRFAASGHVDFSSFGARGGGVVVWDLQGRRAIGRYEKRLGIETVAFSPDEALVLVGGRGNRAKVLRRDGTVVRELPLCDGCWGFAGAFSQDGNLVVLCESPLETPGRDAEPSTKVWDLKTGKVVRAFPRSAVDFARDGSLAMEWNGALWNWRTGRDESAHRPPRDADWTPRALSGDGRHALLSCISRNAGPVGLWDPTRGSEVRRLTGHTAQVRAGTFSDDGKLVFTGAGEKNHGWQDCTVRVWDRSSAHELATLRGHDVGVEAVAVTPNGRRVVSGDGSGRVILWELSE
jgi:WD40 repeat protein